MFRLKKIAGILIAISLCFSLVTACQQTTSGGQAIKSGMYTGEANGHGGTLAVTVEVGNSGNIEKVEVTSNTETEGYGDRAVAELPAKIVAAKSLAVDATTGATITSRAILAAVADAITKAGGDPKAMGYIPVEDISSADVITIKGLPGGEVALTGAQLKADYSPVAVSATSVTASGESQDMTATGVKLETILQGLGVSQANYASIIFTATDGYSIEVPDGILQTRDILIAYEVDGQPQSPRTVVPEERAMYWVKFLSTIELMNESIIDAIPVTKVVMLEGAIDAIKDSAEDYKYYDSTDQAMPINKLLAEYVEDTTDFVTLKSTDQWGKNEKYDTFADQFIKFTGKDAPLFVGPSLPEGMRLKKTLSMQIGGVNILSAKMSAEITQTGTSLPLQKLFELSGIAKSANYTFTAEDGYTAVIAAEDIAKGTVKILEDDSLELSFEGLAKNTTIKAFVTITADGAQ